MPPFDITALDQVQLNALAVTFTGEFTTNEGLRLSKETEWLQSLRQSKNIHDPEIKFGPNDSQIYSGFTRSKEVPLRSKLNQHLIPEKERNFAIAATPKPRVDETQLQEIISPLVTRDEAGNTVFPDEKAINTAIVKFTEERAANMTNTVSDQLTEAEYNLDLKEAIKSGIRYGTGVIKGPLTESFEETETVFEAAPVVPGGQGVVTKVLDFIKKTVSGEQAPAGKWIQRPVTKYRPDPLPVSLWRFYPDMSTTDIKKCSFAYELHSMTKHEMLELSTRADFRGDVILNILTTNEKGNYKMRSWETQIQSIPDQPQTTPLNANAFEVVERNGYIDGKRLFEAGAITEDQIDLEYFCSFWFCANRCIKITPWPAEAFKSVAELYHLFYYEKDETSIFGTGLPKVVRDRQLAMNAGERHLLGHAAWLTAPCGEINLADLTQDSKDHAAAFGPGSFLARVSFGQNGNNNIIKPYYMQDNVTSLIGLLNFQRSQGDQETSLPSSLFGAPPVTDTTAKSDAIRFENLLDFIKDLARNFDAMNTSVIRAIVRWNMKFNPDPSIKGDLETKAVGSAESLIRNAIREQISFFMQSLASMPPEVMQHYDMHELALLLAKSMFDDVNKIMRPADVVAGEVAQAQQEQSQIKALEAELARIKGMYDQAKAEAQQAKADKIRAEMPHDIQAKSIAAAQAEKNVEKTHIENVQKQVEIADALTGGPNVGTA